MVLASEPHGGQCCVLWSGIPRGSALYIGISKDKLRNFTRLQAQTFEPVFLCRRSSVCVFLGIYFPVCV